MLLIFNFFVCVCEKKMGFCTLSSVVNFCATMGKVKEIHWSPIEFSELYTKKVHEFLQLRLLLLLTTGLGYNQCCWVGTQFGG